MGIYVALHHTRARALYILREGSSASSPRSNFSMILAARRVDENKRTLFAHKTHNPLELP